MKLLDAAEVINHASDNDWHRGEDFDARECGVSIRLSDCEDETSAQVIGDTEDPERQVCPYTARTFGFTATLRRTSGSMRNDDEAWLRQTLAEHSEIPVARSLLLRQVNSDIWVGNPDAHQVSNPGLTDPVALADAIDKARQMFFQHSLAQPIMHVKPGVAPRLKAAGVIDVNPKDGEDYSVWGDRVVISEGYYDAPGLVGVPPVFFTGPITVELGTVESVEQIIRAISRTNRSMAEVNRLARVTTAPCSIVRVGPAPTTA